MKNLLKKIGASLTATLLLVIASQAGAFAQGGSESLTPAGVIGGVALIIALVVLLAVKGSHKVAIAQALINACWHRKRLASRVAGCLPLLLLKQLVSNGYYWTGYASEPCSNTSRPIFSPSGSTRSFHG